MMRRLQQIVPNIVLIAMLIALISCSYRGTIESQIEYAGPELHQQERQPQLTQNKNSEE